MTSNHFLKLAIAEAAKSTFTSNCSSARVGCVVTLNGTVISRGFNSNKSDPIQERLNVYNYTLPENCYFAAKIHAEIQALKKIRFLDRQALKRCVIYVARITKDGKTAMARPCAACESFARKLGITHVIYTTSPDSYASEYYNERI